MKLPQHGERWVVEACMDHDNAPGLYIWNNQYHDQVPTHSVIRVKCGCVYQEGIGPEAEEIRAKAVVET